jgi:hypothetical protein
VILSYHRADGRRVPAEAEAVTVDDDGAISGWRSVSLGAVGSFAGRLPDGELADLRDAVAAVAGAAPPGTPPPPGSPTETLDVAPHGPVDVAGVDDGAWGELTDRARALLDRMTDFPRAAVALDVEGAGHASLVHRGTEPVDVDLTPATVRHTRWHGYYESADETTDPLPGGTLVHAEPGWSLELPAARGGEPGADVTWHLTVTFAIVTPNARVDVELQHAPQPAAPA